MADNFPSVNNKHIRYTAAMSKSSSWDQYPMELRKDGQGRVHDLLHKLTDNLGGLNDLRVPAVEPPPIFEDYMPDPAAERARGGNLKNTYDTAEEYWECASPTCFFEREHYIDLYMQTADTFGIKGANKVCGRVQALLLKCSSGDDTLEVKSEVEAKSWRSAKEVWNVATQQLLDAGKIEYKIVRDRRTAMQRKKHLEDAYEADLAWLAKHHSSRNHEAVQALSKLQLYDETAAEGLSVNGKKSEETITEGAATESEAKDRESTNTNGEPAGELAALQEPRGDAEQTMASDSETSGTASATDLEGEESWPGFEKYSFW